MMLKGIAHLAYFVSDMNASVKFYETIGLTKAFSLSREDGSPWIEYMKIAAGQFIELFYADKPFEPKGMWKNEAFAHLCLEVDDIHAIAKVITDGGYHLEKTPSMGADGNWQCWSHDPDGNAIEFMQIMADSKQAQS